MNTLAIVWFFVMAWAIAMCVTDYITTQQGIDSKLTQEGNRVVKWFVARIGFPAYIVCAIALFILSAGLAWMWNPWISLVWAGVIGGIETRMTVHNYLLLKKCREFVAKNPLPPGTGVKP